MNKENTHKLRSFCIHSFILLAAMLWQTATFADVAVIAHPTVGISSVNASILKSIYVGRLKSWPDGSALTVIDQTAGSDARILFLKKIVGQSEKKFDKYWTKRSFSGKGTPHKILAKDVDVKAWVANNKESVGYIDASAVDETVKVLLIIK